MNRIYECMVLLDNREVRQGWDALKDNVTGLMTKHGAEIVSARLWEERRLAYPIRQQQRGTYLLVYFNSDTGAIAAINREMNMAEPVMRHLVTTCEEVPESAHEPEKEFDVSSIGVETVAKPERARPASADGGEREGEKAAKEASDAEEASGKGAEESAAGDASDAAGDASDKEKDKEDAR